MCGQKESLKRVISSMQSIFHILNNAERKEVGIDYKQKGQDEAVRTGFRLVEPRLKDIISEAEKVAVHNQ